MIAKLDSVALSTHAGAVIAQLEDTDLFVRCAALRAIAEFGPAAHAATIVAKLEDASDLVRASALEALAMVEPAVFLVHCDVIVAMQASEYENVRQWALQLIAALYAPGGPGAIAAEKEFELAIIAQSVSIGSARALPLL